MTQSQSGLVRGIICLALGDHDSQLIESIEMYQSLKLFAMFITALLFVGPYMRIAGRCLSKPSALFNISRADQGITCNLGMLKKVGLTQFKV